MKSEPGFRSWGIARVVKVNVGGQTGTATFAIVQRLVFEGRRSYSGLLAGNARETKMSTIAIPTVLEARASVAEWLLANLPDRFAAGIPVHDSKLGVWLTPVWLSYPGLEPFGLVGEVTLDETIGEVREHTSIEEMKSSALKLYEQHRDQIEAPLL